jgi:hypothetical protein
MVLHLVMIRRLDIRNIHAELLLVVLSLILATQLFAGTPQMQADAPAAQIPPHSAQPKSKHQAKMTKAIKYVNTKYGFTFSLPRTWRGYVTVEKTWTDANNSGPHGDQVLESGPRITIVNPQSTSAKQYQDIYIMVFTRAQWDSLEQGNFVISAGPIGPGEIGRNRKYVFAEPPRMIDSDNLYGWEEVVKIMGSHPLHAF